MISLIIKSYLSILLSIGIGSIVVFIIGLYWILKSTTRQSLSESAEKKYEPQNEAQHNKKLKPSTIVASDLLAISGEDVLATQLDLARAYIETDKKQAAKKILEKVVRQGNDAQQIEARELLSLI